MSATFSLFETSLLSAQRHKLKLLANHSNKGAQSALKLLDDMDSMLATILLWNNFANVLIASLATVIAVRLFTDTQTVLSVTSVVTTFTILILAEITPKAIGVRFAERVSCFAAPILLFLVKVVPIGSVIRGTLNSARVIFGKNSTSDQSTTRHLVAVNELLAFIHDKNTLSDVSVEHKALLYKMVGMHELTLRDMMCSRSQIEYLDLEDSLEEMIDQLTNSSHNFLPLSNDGLENITGMISVKTILLKERNQYISKATFKEYAQKPLFIPETIEPLKALRQLIKLKKKYCLVVDEYGGLVGMATTADFLDHLFGATVSENGHEEIQSKDSSKATVAGEELVREVNLNHSLSLPEDGAKTVAGLVIEILGGYPQSVGQIVHIKGHSLKVTELEELNIIQIDICQYKSEASRVDDD